jgi:creatinine amidohydrolase
MAVTDWSRLTAEALRLLAARDAVVLLPVASVEQHGPHLPTGVDDILVTAVCRRTARLLTLGMPVVVAPTVWCGLADHHVAFGGTFSLSLATYHALLRDLCRSILKAGFGKIVLVNGHAGNIAGLLEDQGGLMHACEVETSMMMATAPELVDASRLPDAHGPAFDVAASLRPTVKRWVAFDRLTASGVLGDARRASAAKGEALLAARATALARRLQDGEPWNL